MPGRPGQRHGARMRVCWRGVCTQDRARARERARAARRAGHGGGAATASALLGHEGGLAVARLLAVKGQRRLLLVRLLLLLDDRARPRAPRPRSGRGSGRAAVLGLVVGVGALLAELALPLGKLLHRHRAPAHRDPRSLLLALVVHGASVHATTHEPMMGMPTRPRHRMGMPRAGLGAAAVLCCCIASAVPCEGSGCVCVSAALGGACREASRAVPRAAGLARSLRESARPAGAMRRRRTDSTQTLWSRCGSSACSTAPTTSPRLASKSFSRRPARA